MSDELGIKDMDDDCCIKCHEMVPYCAKCDENAVECNGMMNHDD